MSLDGSVRKVNGILPLVSGLKDSGITTVFVPAENAKEAALVQNIKVYGVKHLVDVVSHFSETPIQQTIIDINKYLKENSETDYIYDFKDVKGQQKAKKALQNADFVLK